MMHLDALAPLHARVGFGSLGTAGSLGYENKGVSVKGTAYSSALSTHPPARLLYHVGGSASRLTCAVAIDHDVARGGSNAGFVVAADGREIAAQRDALAEEDPRPLAPSATPKLPPHTPPPEPPNLCVGRIVLTAPRWMVSERLAGLTGLELVSEPFEVRFR
jgi:NPCBM/NEW2 domain